MHRSRPFTALLAMGTTAAALLTPAVLALPASAAPAPAAAAAAPSPAAVATLPFSTWPQAENAAGFNLHRPTRLHGMHRNGPVNVDRCEMPGEHSKTVAAASYGELTRGQLLSIAENNSGSECTGLVTGGLIRKVSIHGVTGRLYGDCGQGTGRGCRDLGSLEVLWKRNGIVYEVKSLSQSQTTILNFARHLHWVR